MAKTIFDNIWVERRAMAGQVLEITHKHYTEQIKDKVFWLCSIFRRSVKTFSICVQETKSARRSMRS